MNIKNLHFRHLLELNIAMFFIGTSGVLARSVDLPVPVIIGLRAILALVFLFLYCRWRGISLKIAKKHILPILTGGVLMAMHWITYFFALKLSNVAIGMLAMFTYPVFTAFLEPLLLKTQLQKIHVLLGFLVLLGIYFLVPDFDMENSYTLAILIGISSAILYALRNLLFKTKVGSYNGSMLMCYQMAVVAIVLLPFVFSAPVEQMVSQWQGLVALALFTTAIGHTLFLNSFKHFSITTVSILSGIQPIFGILLALIFLKEIPDATTLIGGVLILSSVVIESVRSYKN